MRLLNGCLAVLAAASLLAVPVTAEEMTPVEDISRDMPHSTPDYTTPQTPKMAPQAQQQPAVSELQPEGEVTRQHRIQTIYIENITGYPEETRMLEKALGDALAEEHFTVVTEPVGADVYLKGQMGYRQEDGEFMDSRKYRVHGQVKARLAEGERIWRGKFTKAADCDAECFMEQSRKLAREFRKALSTQEQYQLPQQPAEVQETETLPELAPNE